MIYEFHLFSYPRVRHLIFSEKHRGFGFVTFESAEDAAQAMDNMDEAEFFGNHNVDTCFLIYISIGFIQFAFVNFCLQVVS